MGSQLTQKRYINFGSAADASKIKAINRSLFTGGLLSGGTFTISGTNDLIVAPAAVLFPNGLVMEETETITRTITSAIAKNYTVYYQHNDDDIAGGAAAVLKVDDNAAGGGTFLASIGNGAILGWVKYPGGNVPLDVSMFYYAPTIQASADDVNGEGDYYHAPFVSAPGCYISTDDNAKNQTLIVNVMRTSWSGSGNTVINCVFMARKWAPKCIHIIGVGGTYNSATVVGYGTDGGSITFNRPASLGPYDPMAPSATSLAFLNGQLQDPARIYIRSGVFAPGKQYLIRLTINTPSAFTLRAIGTSPYNSPL